MKTRNIFIFLLVSLACFFIFPSIVQANNLKITNVRVGARNPSAGTFNVLFDIAWENSWRNKINHDAAWIIVRLSDATSSEKKLARLASSGINPTGFLTGTGTSSELYVPVDRTGVFLRQSQSAVLGNFSAQGVSLIVDYTSAGFSESSEIKVSVFAYEMAYIPTGSFYAGDFGFSSNSLKKGPANIDPWYIQNEQAIDLNSFQLPSDFPKGYKGFYMMKYEITEGQWVDFVNALNPIDRSQRDLTDNLHKNTDSVIYRHTVSCSGSPLVCSTARPARALSYLTWMDLCAFLDWAALRPMTELEFEKAARGPSLPIKGQYAWASKDAVAATSLSADESLSNEVVTNALANARFGGVLLSGGDASQGIDYQQGPLRVGIFATNDSKRASSGAGYYGIMDLSGNVAEFVVSIGSDVGLSFTGNHGDGLLTTLNNYQGNADVIGWPGMDLDPLKGVRFGSGSGLRGGSWNDSFEYLRISDRQNAVYGKMDAEPYNGGRGVRSYDGE